MTDQNKLQDAWLTPEGKAAKEAARLRTARKRKSQAWCRAMGIDLENKLARQGVESLFERLDERDQRIARMEAALTRLEGTYRRVLRDHDKLSLNESWRTNPEGMGR